MTRKRKGVNAMKRERERESESGKRKTKRQPCNKAMILRSSLRNNDDNASVNTPLKVPTPNGKMSVAVDCAGETPSSPAMLIIEITGLNFFVRQQFHYSLSFP